MTEQLLDVRRAALDDATAAENFRRRHGLVAVSATKRGTRGWVLLNLAVFVVYSIAGLIVFYIGIGKADISPIFPPAGIAVAAVLVFGPGVLPAIWLGDFCNGATLFWAPDTTLVEAVFANTGGGTAAVAEAVIATWLLRRLTGTWHPFDRARDAAAFLFASAIPAAAIGALIGAASMDATGVLLPGELGLTFVTWMISDAAGIAVFCPLVLAWYRDRPAFGRDALGEAGLIILAVIAVAALRYLSRYPIDYLFLPVVLWAAFRAQARGVTLASAAVSVVTVIFTAYGIGSFVGATDNQSFLLVEGFMAVVTFTGLIVVAVRTQQRRAEEALEAYNRLLEQRVAERTAEVAEKNRLLEEKQHRIDQDLEMARTLQAAILPTDFAGFAATEIAAAMRPAFEMAGDFYDVFRIGEGRLGLVVGDVSGKGVTAAFFMAVARTMLRDIAMTGLGPSACIARVNEALCDENPTQMFVTLFYAELDEGSGVARYVNAGHCEPAVAGAEGVRFLARAGDPALGVIPGRKFSERAVTIRELETLFIYTDGITEAFNRDGELFATGRLLNIAERYAASAPQALVLGVIGSIEAFSAGTVQSDDITCLAVRRNVTLAQSAAAL
jgi:serine phosphatase RsbU (regulator of sigma subunit)